MDQNTTIADLRALVKIFVAARDWEPYHSPKHLSMSIAIEAAELMEHFQWLSQEESQDVLNDDAKKEEIGAELADILIYCMSFANHSELDISEIIRKKMEKNEFRFPPVSRQGNQS